MSKVKINCSFNDADWHHKKNVYTCKINDQLILEQPIFELFGEHTNGKSWNDVEAVNFVNCTISRVPQGLMKILPNFKILQIYNSKINSIEREDFVEYSELLNLSLCKNDIEYLSGDLFNDMKNLQIIWITDSKKLQIIEPTILNGLDNLKCINFSNNLCIDMFYDSIKERGNSKLHEIKYEFFEKFSKSPWKKMFEINRRLKNEIIELKNVIRNEKFKDFVIVVGHKEFKVHKLLLTIHSPVLAEMIENNIDAECLNLVDISEEIFQEILNFIYTDELPKSANVDFMHLLAAAGRIKIEKLKTFAVEKLIPKINDENAFEILNLSIKYECKDLQRKAFEVIKNMIGEGTLADDLANQPERLRKLLEFKKKKDDIEMEFKKLLNER